MGNAIPPLILGEPCLRRFCDWVRGAGGYMGGGRGVPNIDLKTQPLHFPEFKVGGDPPYGNAGEWSDKLRIKPHNKI